MHDPSRQPALSAVVVHWRNEEEIQRLLCDWPEDSRFECVVVDNSLSLDPSLLEGHAQGEGAILPRRNVRLVRPSFNLGFAGGVNRGVEESRAPIVLLLNPDLRPLEGALEVLLEGFDRYPEAAGLAPSLLDPGGGSQHVWQLRPLPTVLDLILQTFLFAGVRGPRELPPAGTRIEQPAGAALAIRKQVLEELGGLDEGFYPAWFEDVDLGRRLGQAGKNVLFCPASRWIHEGGGSVPHLGYGRFLWIYYRNLTRYLTLHHGRAWAFLARLTLIAGMKLRLLLLPLRKPRRALDRRRAAAGLGAVILGSLSGWRRPRAYAELVQPPVKDEAEPEK